VDHHPEPVHNLSNADVWGEPSEHSERGNC
jgi:hypothetical protein